ncbi:simple sugar transport system permease protein [Deinococcus metalli]|uniref:Simple sugar transport system permease protein n=1 Tax=Deinococcus metalli TaxID=1141878 RepID=A0A7W8KJB8_9DEIO|nr:ABC transporter permease [Deinococcus metalli]MBB5378016.1 simple sugar transport system permease protein [Deinococcus metalli]GHF53798.1 sugar ABC transporter permease [Deinococcus metalli]
MRRLTADRHILFLLVASVAVALLATLLTQGTFMSADNWQSMATQLPELGLLALCILITMVSGNGGIDLSVVATANLSAITAGLIARRVYPEPDSANVAFTLTFLSVALLVGLACGLINGLLVARLRFAPILATLGTSLAFQGVGYALTNGSAVIGFSTGVQNLGLGTLGPIPVPLLIYLGVAGLLAWVLSSTPYGLRLYLLGTNSRAAHFTGIDTARVLITTYAVAGVLAAVSGIIFGARANSIKVDYGSSYLLIAILIAVMGGVNPAGGAGKVLGLLLATTALQFLSSSLNLLGLSNFLKDFTWGLLLLLSIALTSSRLNLWPTRSPPASTSPPTAPP